MSTSQSFLLAIDPQVHGLGAALFDLTGWEPDVPHRKSPLRNPPPLLRLAYLKLEQAPGFDVFWPRFSEAALSKTRVNEPRRLAASLRAWLGPDQHHVRWLAVEGQQFDSRRTTPMGMVNLARVAAAVCGCLDHLPRPPLVVSPLPTWTKGQSKAARAEGACIRYRRQTGESLKEKVEKSGRSQKIDDALDAYCIGLWMARLLPPES